MGGERYTTDAQGRVTLPAPLGPNTLVELAAHDFLERRTRLAAERFSLWPSRSPTGLDEAYTARLVYDCPGPECHDRALLRVARPHVRLLASPELRLDPAALGALEQAAAELTEATSGAVRFDAGGAAGPAAVAVSIHVDGSDPDVVAMQAAAVTRRELGPRSEVVRASVVFRNVDLARRYPLVLHELAHVFGLGHSPRRDDVMWAGPELYDRSGLSDRERLAIALMLQRAPGNRFPDDDAPELLPAAAGGPSLIACPRAED